KQSRCSTVKLIYGSFIDSNSNSLNKNLFTDEIVNIVETPDKQNSISNSVQNIKNAELCEINAFLSKSKSLRIKNKNAARLNFVARFGPMQAQIAKPLGQTTTSTVKISGVVKANNDTENIFGISFESSLRLEKEENSISGPSFQKVEQEIIFEASKKNGEEIALDEEKKMESNLPTPGKGKKFLFKSEV